MQDFYNMWDERFQVNEVEALEKIQNLQMEHEQ